jgi:alpha-D-ribose 1-methylphosphonate 5-triphosphate synthase subunit PhnL
MDTAHSSYKLQVKRLNKTFTLHNRGSIVVSGFEDIDFSLKKGQLLALSGPSGAGKSSILKTLFRTYLPTSGEINFQRNDGAVIDLAKCTETMVLQLRRREIGFITQFLKVLPRVTALDAVASPLIETGETETRARQRAGELLLHLGIRRELLDLSPLTFSGGEQQRVNIARGIIAPKELLFIDEPTASLDTRSASIVLEILEDLKKQGIAMIAIFHDQKKIDRVADLEYAVKRSE